MAPKVAAIVTPFLAQDFRAEALGKLDPIRALTSKGATTRPSPATEQRPAKPASREERRGQGGLQRRLCVRPTVPRPAAPGRWFAGRAAPLRPTGRRTRSQLRGLSWEWGLGRGGWPAIS